MNDDVTRRRGVELSPDLLRQARALEARSDNNIDFSDMPETTDFSGWVRRADIKSGPTIALPAAVTRSLKAAGFETGSMGRSVQLDDGQAHAWAKTLGAGIAPEGAQVRLMCGHWATVLPGDGRLVVLRIVSPMEAEVVYDGPNGPAWKHGRPESDGQRSISAYRLRYLMALAAKRAA